MRPRSPLLGLIGAGLFAGIAQVVLLRALLNIAAGNELTIGLMLAGWLLAGALGTLLIARRPAANPATRFCHLSLLAWPAVAAGLAFTRYSPILLAALPRGLGAQTGEVLGLLQLLVVALLTVLPAGLLAGALFAAGLAFLTKHRYSPGHAYAFDALGHLAGGILAAVLLYYSLNPQTMALLAAILCFIGIALAVRPSSPEWEGPHEWEGLPAPTPAPSRRVVGVALLWLLYAATFALLLRLPSPLAFRAEPLLAERETIHGSLAVTRFGSDGAYFYLNGVPAASSPPTPGIQHLIHFPMLQLDRPRVVLLIGGGATGGLRELLQYTSLDHITYAELDPALISLARQYAVPADRDALADPRVGILNLDGRVLTKRTRLRSRVPAYDAVILALPDPATAQLNRFYTQDFFREVAAILKPDGVLALQIPSSDTYLGDELLRLDAVLLRTVQSVFPQTALLPGDPLVIAASRTRTLTESSDLLRARLDSLGLVAPEFRSHAWDRLFPFEIARFRRALAAAPPLPLNTDVQPVGYFYDQAFWVAQHSQSSWAIFRALSQLTLPRVLLALAAVLIALAIPGLARPTFRRAYVPLTIFGAGFIGMALEVTLLFAFQVYYGYVYTQLGIITGAFMLGLAAGGILSARRAARLDERGNNRYLLLLQALMTVVALALPILLYAIGRASAGGAFIVPNLIFPLLTAVVGLVIGAEFPVAAALSLAPSPVAGCQAASPPDGDPATAASSAARIYAADLLGACLGALVAGAALLPVVGLYGTCYTAAALAALLTILLLTRISNK